MPSLSKLKTPTRVPISLPVEDESLNLTINDNTFTGEDLTIFTNVKEDETSDRFEKMLTLLVDATLEWDLTDQEVPLPINRESYNMIPAKYIFAIFEKVAETINPPPKAREISSFG